MAAARIPWPERLAIPPALRRRLLLCLHHARLAWDAGRAA